MPKLYKYVFKRLLPGGGLQGQVLTKKSGDDFDIEWKDTETGEPDGETFGSHDVSEDNIGHQRMMAYNDNQGEIVYVQVIDGGIFS